MPNRNWPNLDTCGACVQPVYMIITVNKLTRYVTWAYCEECWNMVRDHIFSHYSNRIVQHYVNTE